jgi:hypothetical protein
MPQRPWAIDGLIVHDDESLRSVLIGGDGLPAARAWMSARHGYWPRVSGLSRQAYRMTLETYWLHSTEAERLAARTALLQALNPEMEEPVRLTAVDHVLPGVGRDGVLLALGPWDVYCDDDGAWHVRDLLQPDTVEANLSGGWQIGFDGGLQIAEAVTAENDNPSFEVNVADDWTFSQNGAGGSVVQDTSESWSGNASVKITSGNDWTRINNGAITVNNGEHITVIARVKCGGDPTGDKMVNFLYDLTTPAVRDTQSSSVEGEWEKIVLHWENTTGGAVSTTLYCQSNFNDSKTEVWIDAVNITKKAYPVPYCDGSLGPGHSWSGAAHNSTSSRTAAECELDDYAPDLVSDQWTIAFWFIPGVLASDVGDDIYLFEAYGGDNDNRVMIWFDDNSDEIRLYVNGGFRCTVDPSSIAVGDEVCIVATGDYDADEWNLYVFEDDGTMDTDSNTTALSRPSFTAMSIGSSDGGTHQANGVIDRFMILDHVMTQAEAMTWQGMGRGGINARRLDVLCEAAVPWAPGGVAALDRGLVSTLVVDEDVRWRQRDGDVAFWRIYDDTWEITIDVDSDDDAWPEFRITPRTGKTSGFAYKQWQWVPWGSAYSGTLFPTCIGPIDFTGKAQGDGDDIRVYVDGEEVDRWLGGALINSVKIWINLDFEPEVDLTLAEAIAAAGDIDYIQFNEDITDLPVEGIIRVESETFSYTDKNNRTKKVSGISRATRGTAAAGHAASTAAYWVQHDVWIYYDDATLPAPTVDDDYEPAFDLDNSTNASWVYTEFGEDDGLRAAQWERIVLDTTPVWYDADHYTNADPWEEIGMMVDDEPFGDGPREGRYQLYCPCGISNVNFSNGEARSADVAFGWHYHLKSSVDGSNWTNEYNIPEPALSNNWEPWNYNAAITADSLYIALYGNCNPGAGVNLFAECADVTLTIDNDITVTAASELDNYPLECTITNDTTGEAITITAGMVLDQILVVNTDEKSAILDDGTRLATAVVTDTTRRDWLRLIPGENDLEFEDTGTQELEIDILWDRRLFE